MADKEIKFMFSELEKYKKHMISQIDFIFIKLVALKDQDLLEKYKKLLNDSNTTQRYIELLTQLESEGFIKIIDDDLNYELRPKMYELFKTASADISSWIEEWRKLFPRGSNRIGYRYRGDKQGCIKKMNKFVKNNPSIKRAEIFAATKKYIKTFESKGSFEYMKLANYFIEKDGNSTLLSEIEGLSEDMIEEFNFVERL